MRTYTIEELREFIKWTTDDYVKLNGTLVLRILRTSVTETTDLRTIDGAEVFNVFVHKQKRVLAKTTTRNYRTSFLKVLSDFKDSENPAARKNIEFVHIKIATIEVSISRFQREIDHFESLLPGLREALKYDDGRIASSA